MTRARLWWLALNYGPAVVILIPVLWVDQWAYRLAILITGAVLLTVPMRLRHAFKWGYAVGCVDTLVDAEREPDDRRPPGYVPEPWDPRTDVFPLH